MRRFYFSRTVEPQIMDTLKSGKPPYNGHTVRPLPAYSNVSIIRRFHSNALCLWHGVGGLLLTAYKIIYKNQVYTSCIIIHKMIHMKLNKTDILTVHMTVSS